MEKEQRNKIKISKKPTQIGQLKIKLVPQVVKPVENKADYLFIADIKEFSTLDLYLDEIISVRRIEKHNNLPERIMFTYKGGIERA